MNYNKAPLPFQGQKRNFIKQFNELIRDEFSAYKDGIFLDAFGGSGLLSHNIKQIYPNARVIYNDFDNYSQRLANIEATNEILATISPICKKYKKGDKISDNDKEEIIEIVDSFKKQGYFIDTITLSSYLLFSGRYAHSWEELKKAPFYSKRGGAVQYEAKGYLQGVEVVQKDAIELIKEYKNEKNVLVLDPPYLQTDMAGYAHYWGLKDFLRLCDLVRDPFIFFSSSNSHILEFLEWGIKHGNKNFKNYKIKQSKVGKVSFSAKQKDDYMIYKSGIKDLFDEI
ncbi:MULTISPECIES: DNA adenine methylase [unclassified Campylobacter]|uniref:DNA adenine methylase n=1 Tax=unclassified Campylobacter TaxID=2593542 RepID=UPI003D3332C8